MKIGDEVYIHGYINEIRNDVIIIRNEGGYFGTSDREIFYYEEDERGYGTMNEADRKTEPSDSEKPNNSLDKDTNVRNKDEPQIFICACETCKHRDEDWDSEACDGCCENNDHYEPQTERSEK